jgi:sugar O-acyltransferase (sialic acid O-acetyltransferase NeuD family)
VVIVGAGRQGRNVADILAAEATRPPVAGYLDDTKDAGTIVERHAVLGPFAWMDDPGFVARHAWMVALGDNLARQDISRRLAARGADFINAIHPTAVVSEFASLGRGVFVNTFSRVGGGARLGDWSLIEGLTWVGVDVEFEEAARCGPGCVIAGPSVIGARTFLGAGAVVSNNIRVGSDCIVGANAAVVRDLADGVRAYGVPARPV